MSELPGGYISRVVRVGDTVRRRPPKSPDFVHALLRHLEGCDWTGAPRFLGVDEEGRQILSYVPGWVGWLGEGRVEPAGVWSAESFVEVAKLVREFHDLTAGTRLAGDQETVCHNDLSSKNTVFRDLGGGTHRPVAFIDWDDATPGSRIHDVADMCWAFPSARFVPERPDVKTLGRLMRLMCDAYGLTDRSELIATVLARHDQTWRGIAAAAEAGDPAYQRLCDLGAVESVRATYEWTAAHQADLERALHER